MIARARETQPPPSLTIVSRTWTVREDAIIKQSWGVVPTREVGARLGRTSFQIAGRAQHLGLVQRVVWTERERALLSRHYRSDDSAALDALVAVTGKKRHQVAQEAKRLGLVTAATPDWTPEEEQRLIDMWGHKTDRAVARHLGRTVTACKLKAKRLGICRIAAHGGLTSRQVAQLFGIDEHKAIWWIERGWLEAAKSHLRYGKHQFWRITEAALVAFIEQYPHEYDRTRMDDPSGYYRRMADDVYRRDPLYTVDEAATRLGVKRDLVLNHIKRGWLPAVKGHSKSNNGIWYVRGADLPLFRVRRPELIGHRGRNYDR